jgi:hypothetical protein
MDVTPSPKMFQAMKMLVDVMCGEEPNLLDQSKGAIAIRNKRVMAFDLLHRFVALSMREGVNRAVIEAQQRRAGPRDMADRNAEAQAVEDAMAGRTMVNIPGQELIRSS